MNLSEFDYELPRELIAQEPLPDRAASRMLVVYRDEQRWEDRWFREFPSFLRPGDCLVLNDSRVIPCRLFGRRKGVRALPIGKNNPKRWQYLSGKVEVLLLEPLDPQALTWKALVHPGRKIHPGEWIQFADHFAAEVIARGEFGERTLRLHLNGDPWQALERYGHTPLPKYIHRPDQPWDRERYQTVYARVPGSAAAPTAGLHFTPEILEQCRQAGAEIAFITLHVGLGTFRPLRTEIVECAKLHAERYSITEEAAAKIRAARRVVAVGTTTVRTLETAALKGEITAQSGQTDLFIYPGFEFKITGAMLTNFHLPRSSLLLLVCAFAGKDLILAAYRHAVENRYRFYSYGDCMLIL